MRILFVINAMGRGGAEVQVRDLAIELARRGHQIGMVVLLPFEEFEPELNAAGVATFTLGMRKGVPSVAALGRLVRTARRFAPDVVHSHMFSANVAARALAALLRAGRTRVPLVNTAHVSVESARRHRAYRLTSRLCDRFTFVSPEAREQHRVAGALAADAGDVVPNGVDLGRFQERDDAVYRAARAAIGLDDAFVWLAVGSLRADDSKDYGNMLRAFARVASRGPRTRLLIAGEGALLEAKRAEARALGVLDRVQFLGLRKDVDTLLQAADGYVMSSAWEGLPIVLLEAAATGLPIVATDVGANADVLAEGAGVLVPPKDSAALASAMERVMAAPEAERAAFGAKARQRAVSRYDLKSIATTWERLYAECCDAARSRA